MPGLSVTDKV